MDNTTHAETTVDLIIIGGGCAGLSLAMRLAQLKSDAPTTLVLENRSAYHNDRTWCFWRDPELAFETMVQHQWTKIRVRSPNEVTVLDCQAAPYQLLPSHIFYREAEATLAASSKMRLLKQATVLGQPQKNADGWSVPTDRGNFQARMIVDTRPDPHLKASDTQMWQSFYGEEVECDADVFDPTIADLMDFSQGCTGMVKFLYVLPMSKRRALVEITVFSPRPMSRESLQAECKSAVEACVKGERFRTARSEHGILPMGNPKRVDTREESYVRVGLHAGAARASTGYAFQRIQRWAVLCAVQLAKGAPPVPHRRDPALLRWMDNLFLRVIKRRPEMAPLLFVSVFKNAKASRLIRFLNDNGTFFDYVAIVRALPAKPFISEILKIVFGAGSTPTQKAPQ